MRCTNSICQKKIEDLGNHQECPFCNSIHVVGVEIDLPRVLRGRAIQTGNVVPTVARLINVINIIQNVNEVNPDSLRSYERTCLKKYNLTNTVLSEILHPLNGDDWISIVRRHILANNFPPLGVHPFTIYTVAWIAQNYGSGATAFREAAQELELGGTDKSINAIWQVGKRDGVDLELLNNDGSVADWSFFRQWLIEPN